MAMWRSIIEVAKRVILEIYDEMAAAMRGGPAYRTRLDPPPGDARVCHPGRGSHTTTDAEGSG